jgi:hypothetical protein
MPTLYLPTNKPPVLWLRQLMLPILLMLTALSGITNAQNADSARAFQPSPRIRVTGVLRPVEGALVPTFPQIRVWVGEKPWLLQVCQIEPVIPAYPAAEELRKVTGLGLRLVTDRAELATLRHAARDARLVVIEGLLRVDARQLRVDATHTTDVTAGQCPTARTVG